MQKFYLFSMSLLILYSCATSRKNKVSQSSRYVITAEEIAQTTATNALEALELLRPNLLRYRGTRGRSVVIEPVVYVDNLEYGKVATLRDIPANSIKEIKYLNASDATTRFGTNNMGGAFVVKTKSQ